MGKSWIFIIIQPELAVPMRVKIPGKYDILFITLFLVFFGLVYSGLLIKIEVHDIFYNIYQLLSLALIFFQLYYIIKSFFVFGKANWKYITQRSIFIALGVTLLIVGEALLG